MDRPAKLQRPLQAFVTADDEPDVFPINDLPEAIMVEVLRKLPTPQLIKTGYQVCRQWAAAAEVLLSKECSTRRWVLPRRPRGADSVPHAFPARALYMRHVCIACGQLGEFPVRAGGAYQSSSYQRQMFLLCKRCTRNEDVQAKLQAKSLYLDAIGVTGKKLLGDDTAGSGQRRGGAGGRGRGRGRGRGQAGDVLDRIEADVRRAAGRARGQGQGRGRGQ